MSFCDKVKTTQVNTNELKNELSKILQSKEHNGIPEFKNIEFWFKNDVVEKLATLKTAINKIKDNDVKDFFLVAFSETIRNTSYTRKGEFKLYRIAEENLHKHNPNVFKEFEKITLKNINGMEQYKTA